ncbi:dethiobiotin synthetase [Mucilaginibacter mallensis]|uniref:ATP-dependent dethiobiotin synthetase BioD n=2 Tax=Mucilaginibacter mallensis TaxID=652787 RepID=A0A1H1WZD1_MUCMA|nr:dethiobiotin synthetase [Mucilaginibacter mallensis]
MPNKPLFITGIGTGIGKTIVSAILTEKLKADYWKPVQSGDLDDSDTLKVKSLISNTQTVFHPETYRLTQPFSPHKSAAIDGVSIEKEKFITPKTDNQLLIEGAGGLMVPLNNELLMIDLIKYLDAEIILVSQNYLGSINHTLLSVAALKQYNIPIKGIIFNGKADIDSESYILKYKGLKLLGHIPEYKSIDKNVVIEAGEHISL